MRDDKNHGFTVRGHSPAKRRRGRKHQRGVQQIDVQIHGNSSTEPSCSVKTRRHHRDVKNRKRVHQNEDCEKNFFSDFFQFESSSSNAAAGKNLGNYPNHDQLKLWNSAPKEATLIEEYLADGQDDADFHTQIQSSRNLTHFKKTNLDLDATRKTQASYSIQTPTSCDMSDFSRATIKCNDYESNIIHNLEGAKVSDVLKSVLAKEYKPIPARPSNPLRYKTELCRAHDESGFCRFGVFCTFAHGPAELRAVPRHHKYKTELCRSYHSVGYCQYGARCHFIHDQEDGILKTATVTAALPALQEECIGASAPISLEQFIGLKNTEIDPSSLRNITGLPLNKTEDDTNPPSPEDMHGFAVDYVFNFADFFTSYQGSDFLKTDSKIAFDEERKNFSSEEFPEAKTLPLHSGVPWRSSISSTVWSPTFESTNDKPWWTDFSAFSKGSLYPSTNTDSSISTTLSPANSVYILNFSSPSEEIESSDVVYLFPSEKEAFGLNNTDETTDSW